MLLQGCSDCIIEDYSFFARKVDFGAKIRREELQERATDFCPVKKKETKREREREGRKD